MDFPFGHGHRHNRRHDDDDEQRFPPPPGYDGPHPPRPGYGGDDDQRFPPPPGYDGPHPPRPGYGGDDEQRFPPPPGYDRPPPSRPGYGGDDSYSYGPPPVQHTSHEYVPSQPLPVEDFYDEPPPSNYPPPGDFGGYGREEPSHHRPHGGDRPFSSSNPVGRAGHGGLGGGEMERQPTVRIFTKAKEDYALAARDGKVVLVPSNPRDEYQHWIKDLRYSTKVKDQEGFPRFALVNKATGEAIKHSIGASHPVRLVPYQPDYLDESVLWTESGDTGEGFRCIRMVNNIDLNFDAWHGDEDHGGVHEGDSCCAMEVAQGEESEVEDCSLLLRNCAFVDFSDEALANQAHSQLNRLRFLGKVLTVERVGKVNPKNNQSNEAPPVKDSSGLPSSLLKDTTTLKSSVSGGEPIAARLGVDYPFPPHLEYEYPPPDGNILTNIVNALIAVPRFYTQVLHLMNKMNLPAPFRMALPTPPLPPPVPSVPPPPPPPPPITAERHLADLSSDESELESSEEDDDNAPNRKKAKLDIVGPAIDKDVPHEAVGLKPVTLVPKEVPIIKKKNTVLQIKIAPKPTQKDVIDDDDGRTKELAEPVKEHLEEKSYAAPKEIESGKLPPEEILSLPMFKNYAAGNPTTVLYIKNLAKDVVVDDFYFIFGSLFGSVESARSSLNIKLMQEGRMRGQAFVTFPSIDLAHHALKLVNGYVFKGKPMIIQFGRNPASGKTN